jgi:hypothetical protein
LKSGELLKNMVVSLCAYPTANLPVGSLYGQTYNQSISFFDVSSTEMPIQAIIDLMNPLISVFLKVYLAPIA